MAEPILDPAYWRSRLQTAPYGCLHHAVFKCPKERWQRIEEEHRAVLAAQVEDTDCVLDAGCGYGRLLDLMPRTWTGGYIGVDLSPDFVLLAQQRYQLRQFLVGDLRKLPFRDFEFDVAVLVSIRPMVRRNLGEAAWLEMQAELNRVSERLLFLEYDEENPCG